MKLDFNGKVAVVTGADGVIGATICKTFVENGAKVVAAGENEDAVKELAQALGSASIPATVDTGDMASVTAMIEGAVKAFGRIDMLVNATFVENKAEDHKPMQDYDDDLWTAVINKQLNAVFYASRSAAAQMVAQGTGGSIVNVTSAMGVIPVKMQCAFVAASAGTPNFTKAMALELGPEHIRVNCVAVGAIEGADYIEGMVSHAAEKKVGKAEDVAAMVALLSDDSASGTVTGSVITVDGGFTAGFARDF